ncbi:uncharacterized protein AC631_04353 [Debaryomyces fabryi]|uniref:Dephospho-CoA kinase CAB5 n=1 Tax=Debaryomyces fabryi TaxID=58627 RepID=A0A0V1PUG4_9ASCO|nr:uncharacterized protein AC631_04353 [Debaryomyces fabryi]KRZ99872.1 hypothetical protein AC631_04353 [Debaryomyces fabryi]CUM46692.1 unnamed protein product [Debaryomyces fabryi]
MLIVGLTGGIGAGKSTVSRTLRETHNLTIVDADLIARDVVNPGRKAYNRILEAFADDIPDLVNPKDGSLNRAVLGNAVFGNKEKLKRLNSIVHPAVRKEILWQILQAYLRFQSLVILDVPLLFEAGLNKICGTTVTVTCDKELQVKRIAARNSELSEEDIRKRIESQMTNEERNYRSDLVIDNSSSLDDLQKCVASVVKEIRPNLILTLLDLFPPFGLLSALYTFTLRTIRDKYKGTKPLIKND